MVPKGGHRRTSLNDSLFEDAFRFDFFQAVRLLEQSVADARAPRSGEDSPEKRFPVGGDHAPGQEVVRFRALGAHSFPAGSISSLQPPQDDSADPSHRSPAEMTVAFMGLTGPQGVLPQHYTSLVIERTREKDYSLRDFFDLFNHRVLSLFYRAWRKYRFPIGYEHRRVTGEVGTGDASRTGDSRDSEDLFTHVLYCLLGLGTGGLRRRMEFDDEALLYYAGHFAHYPRSAVALESLLTDYFELPFDIHQFHGQWLYLSAEDQSSLPTARRPRGLNARLGVEVIVGRRVWDTESKFRLQVGPLDYHQFCRFSPSGDVLAPLCQMVRLYVGPQFDFDVQPVLAAAEVPWCQLGGEGTDGARLGWNTWIRSGPAVRDAADAVFSLEGYPWTSSH
ncbi:MAG: type VI secretion system baseplate subunit TssG [Planctomycetes bacterium]|nr:type VI secretion system baseplate subunit TssG [Planctomycetota bacterium]